MTAGDHGTVTGGQSSVVNGQRSVAGGQGIAKSARPSFSGGSSVEGVEKGAFVGNRVGTWRGVAYDFPEMHELSFEEFMRLPDETRAIFSKLCPNGPHCKMGLRCVRIHGFVEPHQEQQLEQLRQRMPHQAERYGNVVCRDFLILPESCIRGPKCGYRHLYPSRNISAIQACALLVTFYMRVARQRISEVHAAESRGEPFPTHCTHSCIPDP